MRAPLKGAIVVDDRGSVAEARQLLHRPPARELIPVTPGSSGRWHVHDYPSVYSRWNYHPEFEIHLIAHGTGRFIVGDKIDRFAPGQLVLVGSNLPHHWASDVDPGHMLIGRDVVFQFHPQWIQSCEAVLPELATVAPLLARADRGIEFTGPSSRDAAQELRAIGESDGVRRLQHVLSLLATLQDAPESDYRLLASQSMSLQTDEGAADIVEVALRDMLDHTERVVTLAEIARKVQMSESALSRYFLRATGQSFSETQRRLRLARACQLLENTDEPITQIVTSSGYRNISNFNRQFRREYGVTPSRYRRLHLERNAESTPR